MNNNKEGSTMVNPRNTGVPATHCAEDVESAEQVSKVVLLQKYRCMI